MASARYLQRIEELAAQHRKEQAGAAEWKRLHGKASADRAAAVQYADRAHGMAAQYADQAIANGKRAARLRLAWESARRGRRACRAAFAQAERMFWESVRERDRLAEQMAAVRAVHPRRDDPSGPVCGACLDAYEEPVDWPCPTIRALDGPAGGERDRLADVEAERDTLLLHLEEALHLRMHGQRAPGGGETWANWERQTQAILRSVLGEEDGPAGGERP